jgi:hypothetical protein
MNTPYRLVPPLHRCPALHRAAALAVALLLALPAALLLPALLLLSPPARAQGSPPPPCWPSRFGPFVIPGGTGSEVVHESIMDNGIYWAWKCPDGRVGYRVVKEEWKALYLWEAAETLRKAPSVIDALAELWPKYGPRQATCTPDDPCDPDWQRVAMQAIEAAQALPTPGAVPPPPPPPPPLEKRWLVAPLAGGTRATYSLVGGRLLAAAPRATVGQPCDCQVQRFVNAAGTWCAAPGLPQLVTLCRAEN